MSCEWYSAARCVPPHSDCSRLRCSITTASTADSSRPRSPHLPRPSVSAIRAAPRKAATNPRCSLVVKSKCQDLLLTKWRGEAKIMVAAARAHRSCVFAQSARRLPFALRDPVRSASRGLICRKSLRECRAALAHDVRLDRAADGVGNADEKDKLLSARDCGVEEISLEHHVVLRVD